MEDPVSRKVFQVFSSSSTLLKLLTSLFLALKESFIYEPRDELDLKVEEILKRKKASCLSLSKLVQYYLQLAQIKSEIHIAIKFPFDRDFVELKGGILHSFVIINFNGNLILCDPLFSVGFIPENYIYLCELKDLSDNTLKKLVGSKIRLLSHNDRIFYNPQTLLKVELWKPDLDRTISGALIGKILKDKDIFEEGYIVIKTLDDEVKIKLVNGNFCFFLENDGEYTIFFENVLGERMMLKKLFLSHRKVKKVVFYLK